MRICLSLSSKNYIVFSCQRPIFDYKVNLFWRQQILVHSGSILKSRKWLLYCEFNIPKSQNLFMDGWYHSEVKNIVNDKTDSIINQENNELYSDTNLKWPYQLMIPLGYDDSCWFYSYLVKDRVFMNQLLELFTVITRLFWLIFLENEISVRIYYPSRECSFVASPFSFLEQPMVCSMPSFQIRWF